MKKIKLVIGVVVLILLIIAGVWIGVYEYFVPLPGWIIGIIICSILLLGVISYIFYMKEKPDISTADETIKESDEKISIDSDASKEEHQSLKDYLKDLLRNYSKDLERKIDKRMTRRLKGLQSAISWKPVDRPLHAPEVAKHDEKEPDVLEIPLKELIESPRKVRELETRIQALERNQTYRSPKSSVPPGQISNEQEVKFREKEEKMLDTYNKNDLREFKRQCVAIKVGMIEPDKNKATDDGIVSFEKIKKRPEFKESTNGIFLIIKQGKNRYCLLPPFSASIYESDQIKACFEVIGLPPDRLSVKSVREVKKSAICKETEEGWILEEKGKLITEG